MENMDKELTVPKWVLIVRPKIPQMHQKISAQTFEVFEKKLSQLWVSVVRVYKHCLVFNMHSFYLCCNIKKFFIFLSHPDSIHTHLHFFMYIINVFIQMVSKTTAFKTVNFGKIFSLKTLHCMHFMILSHHIKLSLFHFSR